MAAAGRTAHGCQRGGRDAAVGGELEARPPVGRSGRGRRRGAWGPFGGQGMAVGWRSRRGGRLGGRGAAAAGTTGHGLRRGARSSAVELEAWWLGRCGGGGELGRADWRVVRGRGRRRLGVRSFFVFLHKPAARGREGSSRPVPTATGHGERVPRRCRPGGPGKRGGSVPRQLWQAAACSREKDPEARRAERPVVGWRSERDGS
jgi:hypothetical protein